jgi:signal transduction histidine kinase
MAQNLKYLAPRIAWHTYNLRWLLLVLAAVLLLSGPRRPDTTAMLLLVAAGLANFGLMMVELLAFRPRWLTWAAVGLDFGLGLGLYAASGGSLGPLIWLVLLPGLTVALRVNWAAAMAAAAAFLAGQTWLELWMTPAAPTGILMVAITAAVALPLIAATGLAGVRLRRTAAVVQPADTADSQRVRVLRQHAHAVYEMSSMVSATLNYNEVLEAALNFGSLGTEGHQPASSAMVSAVLFFHEDQLHVTSCRRLTTADQRVVCPGRAGVLGDVLRTGEPALIDDPVNDPELSQFASFQACRQLLALPLRAGYETYGVVLYGHPQASFFDEDQRALLTAVVNQAIIALQNAQLYRNLRQEKERLVEVQEEAQKKLARDLHDGPTQAVAALAMRANFVRRLVERDPAAAGDELFKMEDLARRTTKEIRHMLFTLRPLVLESQGLTVALHQLAEKMKDTHGQRVVVEAESGIDGLLELNHQGVVFYIIEEAVNNARKHAQAEHIWVRMLVQNEVLAVEVKDDGVGFNVGALEVNYERRGSLGMVNMRERAEMLNGVVRIDSAEGRGTRVIIYIPLSDIARERLRA